MIVKDDVPAVFRQAIAEGRLSNNSPTKNAAFYMYMFTDDDGVDQFKHIDTRQYLPVLQQVPHLEDDEMRDADKDGVDLLKELMLAVKAVANHDWKLLLEPEPTVQASSPTYLESRLWSLSSDFDDAIRNIVYEIYTMTEALATIHKEQKIE